MTGESDDKRSNIVAFPSIKKDEEARQQRQDLMDAEMKKVIRAVCAASPASVLLSESEFELRMAAVMQQVKDEQTHHEHRLQGILDDQFSDVMASGFPVMLDQALDQREAAQARRRTRLLVRAKKQRFRMAIIAVIPLIFASIFIGREQLDGSFGGLLSVMGVLTMVWFVAVAKMMPALPRNAVK